MFGMLDYRAHKLFLILFFLPLTIINLILDFSIPIGAWAIGRMYGESPAGILVITIISVVPLWIILFLLEVGVNKFILFLFNLIVDVLPDEGRTKEEALIVAYRGDKAIAHLKLNKTQPRDWSDEDIELCITGGFINLFYKHTIRERLYLIRKESEENPKLKFNLDVYGNDDIKIANLLKENNLAKDNIENLLNNPLHLRLGLMGIIFFCLIWFDILNKELGQGLFDIFFIGILLVGFFKICNLDIIKKINSFFVKKFNLESSNNVFPKTIGICYIIFCFYIVSFFY